MCFQLPGYLLSVKRIISNKFLAVIQTSSGNKNSSSDLMLHGLLLVTLAMFATSSRASGVLPESSAVIINEAQHGGSINVKNTENVAVLLYSKIVELPDDLSPRLIVTQPVARLEPGQSQRVRFVLNTDAPLQSEHIKRVYFEGVTEQTTDNSQVSVSIRQDLPVIIVPKGLSTNREMWSELKWSVDSNGLKVSNTGRHVVRLAPQIKLLPAGNTLSLRKSYILPGETLRVSTRLHGQHQVEFSPVTRYGFAVGLQQAELSGA